MTEAATQMTPLHERFQLIINGPALFNAVIAGLELEIFEALSDRREASFEELLDSVKIAPHKLRVLMHALCSTGLIEKNGGCYQNSTLADELLVGDGDDSWRHILIGWQKIYYPGFAETTAALRTGRNTALDAYPGEGTTLYERLASHTVLEATLHRAMAAFTLQSLPGLLESGELEGVRRLLDVGGGDGATAARLVQRYADINVCVIDTPSVVELAMRDAALAGESRLTFVGGDLFDDPFPSIDPDAVLFSHVLEVFDSTEILKLLSKAYESLPAGGKVLIYGFNAGGDETEGLLSARLSLYLNVLATGQGMAYPSVDYETWLLEAGFCSVKTVSGLPYEHGLTVGKKR